MMRGESERRGRGLIPSGGFEKGQCEKKSDLCSYLLSDCIFKIKFNIRYCEDKQVLALESDTNIF